MLINHCGEDRTHFLNQTFKSIQQTNYQKQTHAIHVQSVGVMKFVLFLANYI